jgi:hypothetical protein
VAAAVPVAARVETVKLARLNVCDDASDVPSTHHMRVEPTPDAMRPMVPRLRLRLSQLRQC